MRAVRKSMSMSARVAVYRDLSGALPAMILKGHQVIPL